MAFGSKLKAKNKSCQTLFFTKEPRIYKNDNHHFKRLLAQKRFLNFRSMGSVDYPQRSYVFARLDHSIKQKSDTTTKELRLSNEKEYYPIISPMAHLNSLLPVEYVVAHGKTGVHIYDDINRLIKKLALSFTAKKNEAQFFIGQGIFQGTRFNLVANSRNLSLSVNHASEYAMALLKDHQELLKDRLLLHEINLCDIRFVS